MARKNAIRLYLTGTIGQITVIAIIVFLLRKIGIVVDYTTVIGMIAIGIGGISSAMWGSIVTIRYRKINFKRIVIEFVNIKQPIFGYLLVFMFLSIEFCYLLMVGMLQVKNWYIPVILFVKAILFGGIEEIGWRYTFQPIIEEQHEYVFSTCVTFVCWGIWHFLYFFKYSCTIILYIGFAKHSSFCFYFFAYFMFSHIITQKSSNFTRQI